jgi:hypothetical protein
MRASVLAALALGSSIGPAAAAQEAGRVDGLATIETRSTRRRSLIDGVSHQPGWTLDESAHYFIVTSVGDSAFVSELKERCESIRAAIRKDFPHPDLDPVPVSTAPNVIRVCKDREEFNGYGGAVDSAGYWSPDHGEIVLYDDKAVGGRADTWAALNGTIWLEYIATLHGEPVLPPWFLFGHSDYYSGFVLKDGEYQVRPFDWRQRKAQALIRANRALPLRDLIRLGPDEFKGLETRQLDSGEICALSWSFIWFLRRGANEPTNWNATWDGILDSWWSTWLESRDNEASIERAFAGVDWEALGRAWAEFTLR